MLVFQIKVNGKARCHVPVRYISTGNLRLIYPIVNITGISSSFAISISLSVPVLSVQFMSPSMFGTI